MIFLFALLWMILSPYFDSQMLTHGIHRVGGYYSLCVVYVPIFSGARFSRSLVYIWLGFQHMQMKGPNLHN